MPYIRSFWTDSTPGIQSAQTRDEGNHPVCAFYEINAVECYEAYGFYRGERYCRDFQQDWDECITGWKQVTSLSLLTPFTLVSHIAHALSSGRAGAPVHADATGEDEESGSR